MRYKIVIILFWGGGKFVIMLFFKRKKKAFFIYLCIILSSGLVLWGPQSPARGLDRDETSPGRGGAQSPTVRNAPTTMARNAAIRIKPGPPEPTFFFFPFFLRATAFLDRGVHVAEDNSPYTACTYTSQYTAH